MRHLIFLPLVLLVGCSTPFFRSTQGCFTSVGILLPNSADVGFQIANYLSGQQVYIKDPSIIKYAWNISETNSYFGVIKTSSSRSGEISVDGKQQK